MARTLWLRWMTALCGSLVVGCLYHRATEEVQIPPATESVCTTAALPPIVPPAPPPSPSAPAPAASPYAQAPSAAITPAPAPAIQTAHHAEVTMGPSISGPTERQANAQEPPAPIPAPLDPLVAVVAAILKDNPEEALRALGEYDQNDRELLLTLVRLAVGINKKDLERLSADEAAGTLERLRQLTTQLRQRAPLSLDKVCFCKTIEGFGQYQARPSSQAFRAGSEGQPGERIQVYAEVRNFGCVAKQGQYETRLSSSLSILDEHGQTVTTMTPETSVDVSQTPRQDYFLNFQFHVPAILKAGRVYVLKVAVEDVTTPPGTKKTARTAETTLDFRVCPPPPGARTEK